MMAKRRYWHVAFPLAFVRGTEKLDVVFRSFDIQTKGMS